MYNTYVPLGLSALTMNRTKVLQEHQGLTNAAYVLKDLKDMHSTGRTFNHSIYLMHSIKHDRWEEVQEGIGNMQSTINN